MLLSYAYFSATTVLQFLKQRHLKYILNIRHYTPVKEVITTIQETQYLLAKFNGLDASNDRFLYRWLKKRKFDTFCTAIKHENGSLTLISLVFQTVLLN